MIKNAKIAAFLAAGVAAFGVAANAPAMAKADGDTIVLGAAISFTGKYSTNGKHTKNGYDLAVKRIHSTRLNGINT